MGKTTVIQIVAEHLRANGFDGLYQPEGPCGCSLDDNLHLCGDSFASCEPAYKHSDPRPGREHVWAMFRSKDAPALEAFDALED